jgi:hypothetical protein
MLIRLKRSGRTPVLTCIRPDGSYTYGKMPYGEFFPRHDLMHYAVETTLGLRESFYGLVAAGWSITDFNLPGVARMLPSEAGQTEFIVGELERRHRFDEPWTAGAFNQFLEQATGKKGPLLLRALLQDELDAIRARFDELIARYGDLAEGEDMELSFP